MRTSVCIPNLLWVWGGFPDSSVGKGSACNAGYPGWIPGLGRCAGERIGYPLQYSWASLVALRVKNPSAMRETWVWSLGWKDPLEKGTAIPLQYSGLENSMDCIVHGVAKRWTRLSDTHSLTQFKPVSGGWAIALIALSSWVMHSAPEWCTQHEVHCVTEQWRQIGWNTDGLISPNSLLSLLGLDLSQV